jgi:hypothetical protein
MYAYMLERGTKVKKKERSKGIMKTENEKLKIT